MENLLTVLQGDALSMLRTLPDFSVQCCVTSPPYWGLRDYGIEGQLGLEKTPEEYVVKMVAVFREVRRVLRNDGTLWLNLGDSYAGSGRGGNPEDSPWSGFMGNKDRERSAMPHLHTNAVQNGAIGRNWVKPPRGLKSKDLVGIPWMVAFALRADGWYLRSDIIWHKPNPMPESVTDRPTKSHEYLFLLTKSSKYFYDGDAIAELCLTPIDSKSRCGFGSTNGKCDTMQYSHSNETGKAWEKSDKRNKRSVWTVNSAPYPEAHFATYPPDLIKPCILAGSRVGDTILDPFAGSGTTGMVALELGRKAVLIELNPQYVDLIRQRCNVTSGLALV